jgi:trehalose 6-phosphate phosphatase
MTVAAFAALPRVLVALDFDGTLAPFVLDPLQARAVPGGIEALRAAAALDGVTVAVVSGRDLATLSAITGIGPDDGITLIGSHGAQTNPADHTDADDHSDPGDQANLHPEPAADSLDEAAAARLEVITRELEVIRSRFPAVRLEHKPSAVALHTRGVEPSVAAAATTAALEVGERHPGVHVMPGKNVVELTVLDANKGAAVVRLARATRSQATLYVGDDVTDERAFAALDPASGDLTIKVGDGETAAAHRLPDQASVVALLELFVDARVHS